MHNSECDGQSGRWKREHLVILVALIVIAAGLIASSIYARAAAERRLAAETRQAQESVAKIQAETVFYVEQLVAPGDTFADALIGAGVEPETVPAIINAVQPVFNLRRLRAGNLLAIGRSMNGELRAIRYNSDSDHDLWILPEGTAFRADIRQIPSTTQTVGVSGVLADSLFNAITEAGEEPELALLFADIFGWDIDFYTDPRTGDKFRMVVEKKTYADGRTAGYGRLLAAEYVNEDRVYQAVLFRDPHGNPAYYAPDGKSLKKSFLKSPLKFSAPVTSHFSRSRFHPVLRRHRPHLGTDYAAPTGTPVQAIGDGRVAFAGWKNGGGKTVEIRHANGFETFYLHLSRISVRSGQRVSQGQRIGAVGSTGLATGPHLDFRVRQHGVFRNFEQLRRRLPPSQPVAGRDWNDFVTARDQALAMLPAQSEIHVAGASKPDPAEEMKTAP